MDNGAHWCVIILLKCICIYNQIGEARDFINDVHSQTDKIANTSSYYYSYFPLAEQELQQLRQQQAIE